MTGLRPTDEAKFLAEAIFALDFELNEEDSTPEELADHLGAKEDAGRGEITLRLAIEAQRYVVDVYPDWIIERRSVYDRWCRVLASHNLLKRYVKPLAHLGPLPPTITIDGQRYYRP